MEQRNICRVIFYCYHIYTHYEEQSVERRKPAVLRYRDLCAGSNVDMVLGQSVDLPACPDLIIPREEMGAVIPEDDSSWLDGDNEAVEDDPDYHACAGDSLVSEREANLDISRLLDLLSEKPLKADSPTETSTVKSPADQSSERTGSKSVDWSFTFS